jgi:hypothetical protein
MEPWFSEEIASRFAFLSLLALFALVAIAAKRGRYRQLVMGAWNGVLVVSALLLVLAVLGWSSGQPRYVVFALGFSGFLIGSIFLALKRVVVAGYHEAELRKTIAEDL